MITKFKIYEKLGVIFHLEDMAEKKTNESNTRWYRGYQIVKDPTKMQGEDGLWSVPELYWRKFGNIIEKGFETVSIIQCKEAIDEWFYFSLKIKNIRK